MRLRLVVALVAVLSGLPAVPARAQVNSCGGQQDRSGVSAPRTYPYGARNQVVSLPSRVDGVAIQIGLVRPEVAAGVRVPVIVNASPYFPALQNTDLVSCDVFLIDNFVPQGYAVALVAVRGTGDSGGCFDLFGSRERADLDQAVRWLATRPWSNGRVGMTGKSYNGATPWMVAAAGNPYLKTIVPVSGVPDVFDLTFGSGTPDWRGPGVISGAYYGTSIAAIDGRATERTVQATACPDYAVGLTASAYSASTGELDPFGYWADRRYVDRILRRYRGGVFLVQGLQDWNVNPGAQFPLIVDLRKHGVVTKMLLGQWGHAFPDEAAPPSRREDYADILLAWFDRWLRPGASIDTGPAVQVEDSSGFWRNEPRWPPPGREVTFWLGTDGTLSEKPSSVGGTATVAPDPAHLQDPASAQGAGIGEPPASTAPVREICEQPVCASFETKGFSKPYRIAGLPRLRLSVVPEGLMGGLSVQLYAHGSDGLRRLGWGQVDLRFPHGGNRARAVQPGKRMSLDVELQPLDAVVSAGESLVAIVSMANSYNRLPSLPAGAIALELGGRSSALELLHETPRPSQFFRPHK